MKRALRYLKIALILLLVIAVPVRRMHAGGQQWDPPPFPDDLPPWPNDPPPIIDDPFDPINDLPDPLEIPPPPEDPIDLPLPDPWDIPDPPDFDDPFPDLPSLIPDPFDDIPDPPFDLPPLPAEAISGGILRAAASTPVSRLMPFPNRLPFHPAYSGVNAPLTKPGCDPATASTLLMPGTNKNELDVVTTCPPAVSKRIPVGRLPTVAKATPDGKFALVSNLDDGTISVVDLTAFQQVATIRLPPFDGFQAQPGGIAITLDGLYAYVENHDSDPGSVLYLIDLTTRTVIKTIAVGAFPSAIAITPDGNQVWVPCRGNGELYVIDTLTNTVVGYNPNLPGATGVAFTPNGDRAFVAEGIETGGYVDEFDTTTFQIKNRIIVGMLPHVLKMSPSGHNLFVTNALSNTISQISVLTSTVIRTYKVPGQHPLGLAFIRGLP